MIWYTVYDQLLISKKKKKEDSTSTKYIKVLFQITDADGGQEESNYVEQNKKKGRIPKARFATGVTSIHTDITCVYLYVRPQDKQGERKKNENVIN